jgi:hypothetical protein
MFPEIFPGVMLPAAFASDSVDFEFDALAVGDWVRVIGVGSGICCGRARRIFVALCFQSHSDAAFLLYNAVVLGFVPKIVFGGRKCLVAAP